MAAGRECDPDLCKNCTSTAKGTAGPEERWGNMGMRLRQHARIHMGLSNVSGVALQQQNQDRGLVAY